MDDNKFENLKNTSHLLTLGYQVYHNRGAYVLLIDYYLNGTALPVGVELKQHTINEDTLCEAWSGVFFILRRAVLTQKYVDEMNSGNNPGE